eukprot:TRINITY_DN109866_c0_g1_i1.p1 TRINITY_DN109866_c0_g1~~TRINITY_DN109866_c0_g1_i1.p1  ORF type:complete len:306 (-),score=64.75 TRINITY_DN109866_c0_g1_i1:81-971(-)
MPALLRSQKSWAKAELEDLEEVKNEFVEIADDDVEYPEVMGAFLEWDTNGDGVIDESELMNVFVKLGLKLSKSDVKLMFDQADANRNGEVDYSEFLGWVMHGAHWQVRNHLLKSGVAWDRIRKGSNADISDDGLIVRRPVGFQEPAGADERSRSRGHALVVSSGTAREFSFRLLDNNGVYEGGFEAGFSALPPSDLPEPLPETASALEEAWVSDMNGYLVVDSEKDLEARAWQHLFVREGAVVSVGYRGGKLRIHLDGDLVAEWDVFVPDEIDLYPVVSVFGTTRAIELLPPEAKK